MTFHATHALIPSLLFAEFGAALFGGSAALADERIMLEAIGTVRMSATDEARRVDGSHQRIKARQAHDAVVERAEAEAPAPRN